MWTDTALRPGALWAIQGCHKGSHHIDTLHWGFSTEDRDQRTLGQPCSGPQLGSLGP